MPTIRAASTPSRRVTINACNIEKRDSGRNCDFENEFQFQLTIGYSPERDIVNATSYPRYLITLSRTLLDIWFLNLFPYIHDLFDRESLALQWAELWSVHDVRPPRRRKAYATRRAHNLRDVPDFICNSVS
jgi:hypothetical protein